MDEICDLSVPQRMVLSLKKERGGVLLLYKEDLFLHHSIAY